MLTSLFGDLTPANDPRRNTAPGESGFAATAILESVATEVNAHGQMVDRHSHELVVTGSPAQAIREHFAATRSDLDTATSLITLLDPAGVWAAAVVKALSDAGGQPIERLHLREHTTLRTLATIERTTLVRRHDDTLRIYRADVRAPGSENAEIPIALMERSQMTTVIIGPLQPHAIEALLSALEAATMLPSWRCPNLLFMLPPGAVWIGHKIAAIAWPARLNVEVLSESMSGASAVWNAMLGVWNQVKASPIWSASGPAPFGDDHFPVRVAEIGLPHAFPAHAPIDAGQARTALAGLLAVEGLLGCALVDLGSGAVLARESVDHEIDMEQAGAAGSQLLLAHRQSARGAGLPEAVDEVLTSAGGRQQLVRPLARLDGLCLVALLDKHHANLSLVRLQLMEVERGLGG